MKPLALIGSCLVLSLSAQYAESTVIYWDPEGTTAKTVANLGVTWDTTSLQWATSSVATTSLIAWNSADAACFCAGAAFSSSFTVTVNSTINVAGIFNGSLGPSGFNVTLAGTGAVNMSGVQGISTGGSDGDPTIINVPIIGSAQIEPESTAQLYLNAVNLYTGGTLLGGSGLVNFNNSSSFGTGAITMSSSGGALVAEGSSAITIPNNWVAASVSLNLVGNAAGITYSGSWALGSATPAIASSSSSIKSLDIFSGVMSGTGGFTAWSSSGGTIEFNNAMTYTGPTTVSNIIVLALGPNGAIGNSAVTVQTNATLANTNISGVNNIGGAVTFQAGVGTGQVAAKALFNGSGSTVSGFSVGGNLTLNSTPITLNVKSTALAGGSYRLMSCAGSVSGAAAATPTITGVALPAGYLATIQTTAGAGGHVDLVVAVPPAITAINPTNATIPIGATEVLAVTATGSGLSYQWTLNGGPVTGDVVGGSSSSALTISPVALADAGVYTVTVQNVANSVTATSTLAVMTPAVYNPADPNNSGNPTFTLHFAGPVGQNYRVWSSTDVTLPVYSSWNLVSFGNQFSGGSDTVVDDDADSSVGFYTITVP